MFFVPRYTILESKLTRTSVASDPEYIQRVMVPAPMGWLQSVGSIKL